VSGLTTDPDDPRLGHGPDSEPGPQNEAYLVLSEAERAAGYVRPLRHSYKHETCGGVTTMTGAIAQTYAAQPDFYGGTYCTTCGMHRPVGAAGEFYCTTCGMHRPVGAAGEFYWIEADGSVGPRVGT
jgi:hypothetical protein